MDALESDPDDVLPPLLERPYVRALLGRIAAWEARHPVEAAKDRRLFEQEQARLSKADAARNARPRAASRRIARAS